jgi:hypothetical protein
MLLARWAFDVRAKRSEAPIFNLMRDFYRGRISIVLLVQSLDLPGLR